MFKCFGVGGCGGNIEIIDKRHCSLMNIPDDVIRNGRTLEECYLDANQISHLPRKFFNMRVLRKLTLSENDLKRLPETVGNLNQLCELDVSRNDISDLSDNIKFCENLRNLDLSSNPIQRLPSGVAQLRQLTILNLNDISLHEFPAEIGNLRSLVRLEARDNLLSNLPLSFGQLNKLEFLDLGGNAFRDLPPNIGQLHQLSDLFLDGNELKYLPEEIGALRKLSQLDLSENILESLPEGIGGLAVLNDLTLSQNCLDTLPDSIGQLRKLSILKLDQNRLFSLTHKIGECSSLTELFLTENLLSKLPTSIGALRQLININVDKNRLDELPVEIGQCQRLNIVSVRDNLLRRLPNELGQLRQLHVLDVAGNKLARLPASLKNCDIKALWLSENQAQATVRLQDDRDETTGEEFLTCYLLPQDGCEASLPPSSADNGRAFPPSDANAYGSYLSTPSDVGQMPSMRENSPSFVTPGIPVAVRRQSSASPKSEHAAGQVVVRVRFGADEDDNESREPSRSFPKEGILLPSSKRHSKFDRKSVDGHVIHKDPNASRDLKEGLNFHPQRQLDLPPVAAAEHVDVVSHVAVAQQAPPASSHGHLRHKSSSSSSTDSSSKSSSSENDAAAAAAVVLDVTDNDGLVVPTSITEVNRPTQQAFNLQHVVQQSKQKEQPQQQRHEEKKILPSDAATNPRASNPDFVKSSGPQSVVATGVHRRLSSDARSSSTVDSDESSSSDSDDSSSTDNSTSEDDKEAELEPEQEVEMEVEMEVEPEVEAEVELESKARPATPPPPKKSIGFIASNGSERDEEGFSSGGEEIDYQFRHVGFSDDVKEEEESGDHTPKLFRRDTPHYNKNAKIHKPTDPQFVKVIEKYKNQQQKQQHMPPNPNEFVSYSPNEAADTVHVAVGSAISRKNSNGSPPVPRSSIVNPYSAASASSKQFVSDELIRAFSPAESFDKTSDVEHLVLTLHKQAGGLGISIAGGLGSAPYCGDDNGIFISKASEDKPAYQAGLRVGDKLITVNGLAMVDVPHNAAVAALRHTKSEIRLEVERKKLPRSNSTSLSSNAAAVASAAVRLAAGAGADDRRVSEEFEENLLVRHNRLTCRLQRDSAGGLGLSIAGGKGSLRRAMDSEHIYISKITDGGAAHKSGQLQVGDRLVKINGVDVSEARHDHVVSLLSVSSSSSPGQPSDVIELEVIREQVTPKLDAAAAVDPRCVNNSDPSLISASQVEAWVDMLTSQHLLREREELIRINKTGGPLGLSICGGSDHCSHPFGATEPGVFISKIVPEGTASRTSLRIGDRILSVNGYDVRSSSHKDTVRALVTPPTQIVLHVRHDTPPPGLKEVYLKVAPNEKLGLSIRGGVGGPPSHPDDPTDEGIFVTRVAPNSAASRQASTDLRPGTRILEVNGHSLLGDSQAGAVRALREAAASTNMVFLICEGFPEYRVDEVVPPGRPRLESSTSVDEEVRNLAEQEINLKLGVPKSTITSNTSSDESTLNNIINNNNGNSSSSNLPRIRPKAWQPTVTVGGRFSQNKSGVIAAAGLDTLSSRSGETSLQMDESIDVQYKANHDSSAAAVDHLNSRRGSAAALSDSTRPDEFTKLTFEEKKRLFEQQQIHERAAKMTITAPAATAAVVQQQAQVVSFKHQTP